MDEKEGQREFEMGNRKKKNKKKLSQSSRVTEKEIPGYTICCIKALLVTSHGNPWIMVVGEESKLEKSPNWRRVQIGEESKLEKSPNWRRVQIGEESKLEKSPNWRVVR
jgi:hypothetical protein